MAQIQQSLLNIPCTTPIACFLYCVQHNTPASLLIPISIIQKYTHDCMNICHPVTNHLHQIHHPVFEPTADRPYTDAIKAKPTTKMWQQNTRSISTDSQQPFLQIHSTYTYLHLISVHLIYLTPSTC